MNPISRPSFGLAATVLGLLPAITAAGSMPMVVMVVLLLLLSGGQFRRAGASRRGRARRGSSLKVVLQLGSFVLLAQRVLAGALFRVLGDTFGRDALAPFAHVSSQGALLLLLAERARVLGGFALGFALSSNQRRRLVPLILLMNSSTALWRTVQRVLQRPIGELFVVSVQRVPERPILDAIAHVVHIHPKGERRGGGGYRDNRGEANVGLERALRRGTCRTSPARRRRSSLQF